MIFLKIIGFVPLVVLAYLLYATFFGLIGALIAWDITVLTHSWQFWVPEYTSLGRGFLWGLALLVGGLMLVEE